MVKCSRKSISLTDLWISTHDKLSDFHLSSWQRGESPVPMLAVRLVLAAVATGILIWSMTNVSPYWLIYLTNWGLLLVTLATLSGLVVSVLTICTTVSDGAELPWFVSMYWFMYNIATSIAVMITALYWILLYDPEQTQYEDPSGFWLDVATHALNSCIMVIELVASRTPVRLLHFYQPLGIGLWYAAFSGVYYAAGGTDSNNNPFIYEVLDWRQGGRAGVMVGASAAGLIIVYILVWGVSLCREKLSLAIVRTTSHNLPLVPADSLTRIA
ncbi:unnamed protein product, partial [Iphiclides podalirius]